ncbi:breast carcinoma AMPlified sequence, putative [Pediculus humanus corporis]|uniref:Breast carcinoma AMPlified sequence, putative n=1 Tax=Pediculus humanus subsp. corporis TaxID=121224 RepID=E0VQD1_PEDHC|nr:breast carcinoma AMPlified sequence, putative [Pediculus humanus corporis]EEB15587.1 breast carcinoma AMPlified sequence, putative [Pediculus humanus corporis]
MSAETQYRSPSSSGVNPVLPQPVTDRSIIESVTGFINDVVPTTGSNAENKDVITWARFEYCDVNDPALISESSDDGLNSPPLLLILGYGSGVQVWCIKNNGEASEILSWRRGVVRTLRILQTPQSDIHDAFSQKRPIVALCDSTGQGPHFCSLSFISLKIGDQVKIIKYKNPISDVVSSRRVVVVTFPEKLAILDAGTLEEKKAIITCYPTTGPNPNPIALGSRWLAYAERRILSTHLSSGGAEVYSGQSVTATVLHAAKSLGKGLRDFGDAVANSLAGQRNTYFTQVENSDLHPGVITILDTHLVNNYLRETNENDNGSDVVAHFIAHSEPIVAISFDPSGMLLLTADKRGHDFHVFRIFPHPCGSHSAAVHHLYVLHRGDTTSKVQDIAWSSDSRWVTVSTLRGTTHIFAVTAYGGPIAVRTHATPHVVNRQSRFHRSAGLMPDGRNSPETTIWAPCVAFTNPRLPPFPHPTNLLALAHIKHSPLLSSSNFQSQRIENASKLNTRQSHSEEACVIPLKVAACFAPLRGWIPVTGKVVQKYNKKPVDSLFVMSCSGNLIEYHLRPRPTAGIPKEKICDETPIELEVEAKAQWNLSKPPSTSELQLPLPPNNPLMLHYEPSNLLDNDSLNEDDEHWLSQVEIITHTGPHRRLWMGPQFVFKTFTSVSGISNDFDAVEVGSGTSSRPIVPVLIESTSSSSLEQSPRMYPSYSEESDSSLGPDSQVAENLADAMLENPTSVAVDQGKVNIDFISL